MRYFLAVALVCSPLLVACQKASAAQNTEMAQCAAAMGIEREYLIRQSPPRYELLPPLGAAITYYKYRLRLAGVPDQGRSEYTAFVYANYRNRQQIGKMVTSCGHKLWAIEEYRANYDGLIRSAIEQDPACKPDPSRCRARD